VICKANYENATNLGALAWDMCEAIVHSSKSWTRSSMSKVLAWAYKNALYKLAIANT